MKGFSKLHVACTLLCCCLPAVALAFPEGQWTVTFYSETGSGRSTQGVCINGDGTWVGTTFAGWSGQWYRNGNDLRLHGNYASGSGNDAFELTRITKKLLTGYFQEWSPGASYDNWGTMKHQFEGKTCDAATLAESGVPFANPGEPQ